MDGTIQHVRAGFRSLLRAPRFTVTAAITLAFGIGLATAVFTVAEVLLLRDLPVREQDRIAVLWGETRDGAFDNYPLPLDGAREFVRATNTFERVAFFAYEGAWPIPIRIDDRTTRLRRALVSGNFFDVLGARPVLGRALLADDDVVGAPPVAVLSHAAWQRHFGGEPDVLGRQFVIHGFDAAHTIVGVMPQGLEYPRGTEFWAALVPAKSRPADSTFAAVDLIGRLRPGVAAAAARDELTAYYGRAGAPVWQRNLRGVVNTLPQLIVGDVKPAVIAFAAAVGLLLLMTCINVANLLLVRGLARMWEFAVRTAMGAGRGPIVAQLLAENAILAVVGGALGVLVAGAAIRSFVLLAPPGVPRLDEIHLNAIALAGAIAITGIAMILFGLAPAIMSSRVEPQRVLRSGARHGRTRGTRRAAEAMVAGQVAIAVLVLAAAGVIGRSLVALERVDLSFEPSRLLIGELAVRPDQFDDKDAQIAVIDRLLSAVKATPGVRAASPVVAIPFSGSGGWDGRPSSEGQTSDEAASNPMLNIDVVTPDWFPTFGIPVLRGRAFTEADTDGAPAVVVLSESAARHYWPNDDPIGKRLRMGLDTDEWFTVVGIVPDTRYRELRDARASIYYPLRQSFFPYAPMTLAIRTEGRPSALAPAIRRAVDAVEPGVVMVSATPFETFLDGPLAQPRLNALLLAVFAGAAVFVAATGLFAVMATMVRQRTREMGVRMALGATAGHVRRMVLRRGFAIGAAGTLAGIAGALVANRLLSALLYEVSPTDGVTLAASAVSLIAVAILATVIPARASTRIDPAITLRGDLRRSVVD